MPGVIPKSVSSPSREEAWTTVTDAERQRRQNPLSLEDLRCPGVGTGETKRQPQQLELVFAPRLRTRGPAPGRARAPAPPPASACAPP